MQMPHTSNVIFRLYTRIRGSMAFYPALIACAYVVLLAVVSAVESTDFGRSLRVNLPYGLTDPENARQILGTLITSIVSLTVFSFSMVMVVLNGAASRLSPRVLPGLISDTRHRVILGVYLGSVLYFLLQIGLLHRADSDSDPSLGIVVALITGVVCLVLFVVFIHSVSQSIQVDWVVGNLYEGACDELCKRQELLARTTAAPPDDSDWPVVPMRTVGYLKSVNEQRLGAILRERELVIRIQSEPGFFLVEGYPVLKVSAPLSDEDQAAVLDCFSFSDQEFARSNAAFGMRQMSEIAVKAISPAVNDPVTAIRAINLIGVVLSRLMGVPAFSVGCFDRGRPRLFYRELSMPRLLFAVFAPIRVYASHDAQILITVLQCMKNALRCGPDRGQLTAIWEEVMALREAADHGIVNSRDRRAVNEALMLLNDLDTGMTWIEPLAISDAAWAPAD